jgi:L,D-transpeptidase ErfK/SrfK
LLIAIVALNGCATIEDFFGGVHGLRSYSIAQLGSRPVEEPIARNYFVLRSPEQSVIGAPQIVFTRSEDTFSDLAREYGLGYDEIVAANPNVDPWLPGENTPVLLPTQYVLPDVPRKGIVLNIASMRLFYFPPTADGEPQTVLTYPIGIGRVGWETPLGVTTVISKATDPHWYVPLSVRRESAEMGNPLPAVVPPGPDNPLGTHVLKLEMPGYLIHGTNQPYGVGMRVSHGCVRLYPENIELLYSLISPGDQVAIINEPYLLGHRDGEFYFESHKPLEDDPIDANARLEQLSARQLNGSKLNTNDSDHMRAIASMAHGIPVRVGQYDVDEVFARARLVRNTVEPDPGAPTMSEVRAMIDEMLAEDEGS